MRLKRLLEIKDLDSDVVKVGRQSFQITNVFFKLIENSITSHLH
jgi:hypothetical protein